MVLVTKLYLSKDVWKWFLSYFEEIIAFTTIFTVISKLFTTTLKLAKITHFPMPVFYISIYFIITILLNAIRFYSKMPRSDDSCRTEICRALWSTGVCVRGVVTAWYYRTDKRSNILLLFNSLFFINKFYLAILTDHHFPSITILQENFFLSFRDAG